MLAGDLWMGDRVHEELEELRDFLHDVEGSAAAREKVDAHLEHTAAVVGMQVMMSAYDDAVAAASTVIDRRRRRAIATLLAAGSLGPCALEIRAGAADENRRRTDAVASPRDRAWLCSDPERCPRCREDHDSSDPRRLLRSRGAYRVGPLLPLHPVRLR